MIDTNQLSALVSAFRAETAKESIAPEPSARQSLRLRVGKDGASIKQTFAKQSATDLQAGVTTAADEPYDPSVDCEELFTRCFLSLLHMGMKITTDTIPAIKAQVTGTIRLKSMSTFSLAMTIENHLIA